MYTLEFTGKEIIVYIESVSEKNQLFQSNDQVLSAMREHNIEKLKEILNSKDYGNLTGSEITILNYVITVPNNNDIFDILCKKNDNIYGSVDPKLSLLFSPIDNKLENILYDSGIDFYDNESFNFELITKLLDKAICCNNTKTINYLVRNFDMEVACWLSEHPDKAKMMEHVLLNDGVQITNETLGQQKLISSDSKDSSNETILDTLPNITSTVLEQEYKEVTITGDGSGKAITNIELD